MAKRPSPARSPWRILAGLVLLVAAMGLVAPSQAQAPKDDREVVLYELREGEGVSWIVRLRRTENGQEPICGLSYIDDKLPYIAFELSRGGTLTVTMSDDSWDLPTDTVYRFAITVGQLSNQSQPAQALKSNWIGFVVTAPRLLLSELGRGQVMRIETPQTTFAYDFSTGQRALLRFLKCFHLAPWDGGTAINPFSEFARSYQSAKDMRGLNPNPFEQLDRTEAEAEQHARKSNRDVLRNIMKLAGFSGLRLMSEASLAEEMKSARAGWYTREHYGYVFVDRTRSDPRVFATTKIRDLDEECRGEFASRTRKPFVTDTHVVVEAVGICTDGNSTTDIATLTMFQSGFAWTYVFLPHRLTGDRLVAHVAQARRALVEVLNK